MQLPHPTARWAYTQFLVPNLSHPPSGHCSPHGYWSHQGSPGCYGAEALSPDLTPALTPTLTPSPALTPTLTLTLTLARTLTLALTLTLTLTLTPTITIALTLTLTRVAPAATVRPSGLERNPGRRVADPRQVSLPTHTLDVCLKQVLRRSRRTRPL